MTLKVRFWNFFLIHHHFYSENVIIFFKYVDFFPKNNLFTITMTHRRRNSITELTYASKDVKVLKNLLNKYFGPNILCLLLLEVWLRLPCWILESPKKIGTATLIVNCTKWQKILGPDLKNCTVYLAKVSHSFARITILRHFYCFFGPVSVRICISLLFLLFSFGLWTNVLTRFLYFHFS